MKITQLRPEQKTVFNAPTAQVIDIQAARVYQDGKAVEGKTEGHNVTVLLAKNNYEKVVIRIADNTPALTKEDIENATEPIMVTFENFSCTIYYNTRLQDYALSCKASTFKIINKK